MALGQCVRHSREIVSDPEIDAFLSEHGTGDLLDGLLKVIDGLPGRPGRERACGGQLLRRELEIGAYPISVAHAAGRLPARRAGRGRSARPSRVRTPAWGTGRHRMRRPAP